jgi:hypothetical protein
MSEEDRTALEGQIKYYADRPLLSFTNRKKMHLIGGNELARVHDFVVVVAGRDDDPLRLAKGKPQRFWIAEILEFKLQNPDDAHLIVRWFHATEEFGVYVGALEHGPRGGKKHFRALPCQHGSLSLSCLDEGWTPTQGNRADPSDGKVR